MFNAIQSKYFFNTFDHPICLFNSIYAPGKVKIHQKLKKPWIVTGISFIRFYLKGTPIYITGVYPICIMENEVMRALISYSLLHEMQ